MEIKTIDSFLSYYQKTRATTMRILNVIPKDRADWSYMPGKFTLTDLVRHIGSIERNVFAKIAAGGVPDYHGCGKDLADGVDNSIIYLNEMHSQSMMIFRALNDNDLVKKVTTLNGLETELSNFLRALVVHEIHHRGALCVYLNIIGVRTPSLFGLTEEQVKEISKSHEPIYYLKK
jgi:uncharacterized damage-inducible protein DinB